MNKRKIGLVIDSTFVPKEMWVKENNISVVGLTVFIDGDPQPTDITGTEAVNAIQDGKKVTTSQPSPSSFYDAFKYQLSLGYEHVICLTLSKTLSGTANGGNVVAQDFPGLVTVVDTGSVSLGSLYIVERFLKELDKGIQLTEAIEVLAKIISQGSILFTVDNLRTLVAGGRLSRLSALIGNVFRIKPILRFRVGVLEIENKARGFARVVDYIVGEITSSMQNFTTKVRIGYVGKDDTAYLLEKRVLEIPGVEVQVTGEISPVIAAHIGLGGLGVFISQEEK